MDNIDTEMYDYFLNILPPITNSSTLMQVGEPYDHCDKGAIYITFSKENGHWTYKGNCLKGSPQNMSIVRLQKGEYSLFSSSETFSKDTLTEILDNIHLEPDKKDYSVFLNGTKFQAKCIYESLEFKILDFAVKEEN